MYVAVAIASAVVGNTVDPAAEVWPAITTPLTMAGVFHLFSTVMENTFDGGRRAKAVFSRPLREGRHVWAVASGDQVRVYRIEQAPSHLPHLWPLTLGRRPRVVEGREFSAEDEAEAVHAYAAEIERDSTPQLSAVALADVINGSRLAAVRV